MPLSLDDIDQRIQHWKSLRTSLSEQLRTVARLLIDPGLPPAKSLDTSLEDYTQAVKSLQADLDLSCPSDEPTETILLHRRTLLERVARIQEHLLRIDDIQVTAGDSSVLEPVRQLHAAIIRQLEQTPWQHESLMQEIEGGHHVLDRLVLLLQSPETLTDEVWTQEIGLVQEQFGSPLSTAISRGRVQLKNPQ